MNDASALLGQLAEEFTAQVRAGKLPAVEDFAQRHPELAERIRGLFPTLLFLEGAAGGALPDGATAAYQPAGLSLQAGQTFNQYRLEREIGRGGMGVVFAAVHLPLGKRVALKVLPVLPSTGAASPGSPTQLERFLREAQTAAALHHTNIVPVFDIGQTGGVPYYAMQFIPGRGLDQVLADLEPRPPVDKTLEERSSGPGGKVPRSPAAYFRWVSVIGIQAARGLAHAHERGVIHRDVKPSNLLLDEAGVLWITDFGLARRLEDPNLTHSGALVGTPRYMSPEQAEAARRPVDHRTDIYSLGATLYEMITRRPAFTGQTPAEVVVQIIEREPVSPRRLDKAIPRDLETIVLKAMAKRPEDRYQNAAELADDLERWLKVEPIRARRIGIVGRVKRWCQRNPRLAAVMGTAAAILLTVSVLYERSLRAAYTDAFDNYVRAEKEMTQGKIHLAEAETQRENSEIHLAVSLYQQARTVSKSQEIGRRWRALELLKAAQQLAATPHTKASTLTEPPSLEALRSGALEALAQHDLRLEKEYTGDKWLVTKNGRWAATTRKGKETRLLVIDLVDGREKEIGVSGAKKLALSALSEAGDKLVTLDEDQGVYTQWEVETGKSKPLVNPPLKSRGLVDLINPALSPDGQTLAALIAFNNDPGWARFHLWDLREDGLPRPIGKRFDSSYLPYGKVEFFWTPDGSRLVHFLMSKGLVLVPINPEEPETVLGHPKEDGNLTFALSPKGSLAAVSLWGRDKSQLILWDWRSGKERARSETTEYLHTLRFSLDGATLLGAESRLHTARYFRTADLAELSRLSAPFPYFADVALHADGRRLLIMNNNLRIWAPADQVPVSAMQVPLLNLNYFYPSSDGRWLGLSGLLARGDGYKTWLVRQPEGGVHKGPIVVKDLVDLGGAGHIVFRPDNQQAAHMESDAVHVWDLAPLKKISAWPRPSAGSWNKAVGFASDDRLLVFLVTDKQEGQLWELPAAKRLGVDAFKSHEVLNAVFTADGRYLANRAGGKPSLWETADLKKISFPAFPDADWKTYSLFFLEFSPRGQWLLAGVEHEELLLGRAHRLDSECGWLMDWRTKKVHKVLKGQTSLSKAAFSQDDRLLALGFSDGSVHLYETATGSKLFQWQALPFEDEVRGLAFTADGLLFAGDGEAPRLAILDVPLFRRQLQELGLDWK